MQVIHGIDGNIPSTIVMRIRKSCRRWHGPPERRELTPIRLDAGVPPALSSAQSGAGSVTPLDDDPPDGRTGGRRALLLAKLRNYLLAGIIVTAPISITLFIVWQQADRFRGGSRVSTWIMGIAYRRALRALRMAASHATASGLAEEPVDPADPLEDAERKELLARALETLPLEQRMVLELTYYLGHSCEEIATIVDCPVNTVKTRMFHARRKLKALLPTLSGVPEGEP